MALLSFRGISTPSLPAQGGQRRFSYFNIQRGNPVAVHDADTFARDYAPKIAGTLQPYGGRILTSGKLTALEGNVPQRFVIIEFDSVEKARGWYDSPVYEPLLALRKKTATSTLFIAVGLPK
jgi:uncharacterized protein (DUF1330 family)